MWGLIKFLAVAAFLVALGSRMSNINPQACSRGSLACGTAWWLLLLIAIAIVGLVRAVWPRVKGPDPRKSHD